MGGNSYYMDTALSAMPLSSRYVHYTPVVTNVPPLRDDSAGRALRGQILGLVQFITAHKFWNAQIAQVEMTADRTFELIPVLGKQRILLGDTARLEEKLDNLLAFYRQVLNKVGWDKYETLDLRFAGQVVASPKMAWKAPVDKALSNMSWVKAIMDGATSKDEKNESFANGAGPMTDTLPFVISPQVGVPAGGQVTQGPPSPTQPKPLKPATQRAGTGAAAGIPRKPPPHPPTRH
jgi:cell division protein FtsQ